MQLEVCKMSNLNLFRFARIYTTCYIDSQICLLAAVTLTISFVRPAPLLLHRDTAMHVK